MGFGFIQKWLEKWRSRNNNGNKETVPVNENPVSKNTFSPMTYENPFILYMHKIIERLIRQRKIPYKKLELVIIDAESGRDRDIEDIEEILYKIGHRLNYLLLVTDRQDKYKSFMDEMYEENGLIVQQLLKSAHRQARGNLVLDFEREGGILGEDRIFNCSGVIYLPIYKRPWEISENLDILVPVGYNTLVVDGILPTDYLECGSINERFGKDKMTDRLDREFRKG